MNNNKNLKKEKKNKQTHEAKAGGKGKRFNLVAALSGRMADSRLKAHLLSKTRTKWQGLPLPGPTPNLYQKRGGGLFPPSTYLTVFVCTHCKNLPLPPSCLRWVTPLVLLQLPALPCPDPCIQQAAHTQGPLTKSHPTKASAKRHWKTHTFQAAPRAASAGGQGNCSQVTPTLQKSSLSFSTHITYSIVRT